MKRSAARLAGILLLLVGAAQACGGSAGDTSIPPDDDAGGGAGDGATRSDGSTADAASDDVTIGDDASSESDAGGDVNTSDVVSADASGADAEGGLDAGDVADAADANDGATTPDAADAAPCPAPDNSDTDRHLYVDQNATPGGNGSLDCPLQTILAATTLGGTPPVGSQLTIHVKGDANTVIYDESACVPVGPRTLLTSDYPGGSGPDPTTVYIRGQSTLQSIKCVVRVTGGTLEGVRVVSPTGSTGVNGIVAENGATVRLASARNNTAAGVVTFGSVTLGPGLFSADNDGDGVTINMAATGKGTAPAVTILAGGRGNRFEGNGGHGLHATDRYGQVTIGEASASNNNGSGIFIEAEANTVHTLANVTASNNGVYGVRVTRGAVSITGGTFEANVGHGVYLGNGVDTGAAFTIADSTASGNGVDGVRVDTMNVVTVTNVTARGNAQVSNGAGLYVMHGTSAHVRGSTFLENTVGLAFDQARNGGGAALSALDVGTSTSDLGGNTFGASSGGVRNQMGGLCLLHSGAASSQKAVGDRWGACAPTQSIIISAKQSPDCYDAATYGDVIYLPASVGTSPVDSGGSSTPACEVYSP